MKHCPAPVFMEEQTRHQSTSPVLIVGPAWIGDMVMAHSLVQELVKQGKGPIDIIAPAWSASLARLMTEVDKVTILAVGHGELGLAKRRQAARTLRPRQHGQAYVLPNTFKSALIPWFAHIPERIGWRGEMRSCLLTDARRLRDKPQHTAQAYAALAHGPLVDFELDMPCLQVAVEQAQAVAQQHDMHLDVGWIALCPGATGGQYKQWPPALHAQLAGILIADGWQIVLLGSSAEQEIAAQIKQNMGPKAGSVLDLTGQLELADTLAVLSICKAAIANDSGLMHIAAALRLNTIGVFGVTDPALNGPLGPRARAVCPPGGSDTIDKVRPDAVYEELLTVMQLA